MRGREKPDSSSGSHPPWIAAQTRSQPNHDHDYKRNGTATLFAALNAANGGVYGLCQERHRHQEWLKFLRLLDQTMPPHLDLHLIADNYATHKHPKVQRWFARHPRFHTHFTPRYVAALTTERSLLARICITTSRFDPAFPATYGCAAELASATIRRGMFHAEGLVRDEPMAPLSTRSAYTKLLQCNENT